MRKTIVIALIALLVILASCDSGFGVPDADKAAKYDADGRELVKLNITTSGALGTTGALDNSRSLSNALAREQGEANFVEVIFKGTNQYYRATGLFGGAIPISIEKTTYTTADAIMFIGKMVSPTDYTLLAVGYLTGTIDLKNSAPSDGKVNFALASSLYALLNVKAATPAFEITESTINSVSGWEEADLYKTGYVGSLPSFQVPKTATATNIGAKLTIGGFPVISVPPVLAVNAAPTVTFTPNGTESLPPSVATLSTTSAAFASGNCVLSFTFDTSLASAGAYIITFKIPVIFSGDTNHVITWNIRGGTLSGIAESNAAGSKAEGVLISVKTDPNRDLSDITAIPPILP